MLVAGVDSSTQGCKVVVLEAATGNLVRSGQAPHPSGTEINPERWWEALNAALALAGGIDDVAALSIAGQQHGMVALDADGQVVRDALLWNDTRSAEAAGDLVAELGAAAWAELTGSVPRAAHTVAKLRWLAEHEPHHAARVHAVALPHDWLTWRLLHHRDPELLVTDRSDASGTGYFDPSHDTYRHDLVTRALGHDAILPRLAETDEVIGELRQTAVGPGAGDNAAAALGLSAGYEEGILSLGTSGVVAVTSRTPTHDQTGLVNGFADATGHYLPLTCTINAAQVFDVTARLLSVDMQRFSDMALEAPVGAGGLILVPYFEGERTPDLPNATGALHGIRLAALTPENLARASIEGVICGMADALDALDAVGAHVRCIRLIGGAARSEAVRTITADVLGLEVSVPPVAEYVARGAARQAAWAVTRTERPPNWSLGRELRYSPERPPDPQLRANYRWASKRTMGRGLP